MLIADGLLAFLPESVIVNLFRRIPDHFGAGELAFNDYGGIGSIKAIVRTEDVPRRRKPVGLRGFKDAHHPETWTPRLELVEEASLTQAAEVDLFPSALRSPPGSPA